MISDIRPCEVVWKGGMAMIEAEAIFHYRLKFAATQGLTDYLRVEAPFQRSCQPRRVRPTERSCQTLYAQSLDTELPSMRAAPSGALTELNSGFFDALAKIAAGLDSGPVPPYPYGRDTWSQIDRSPGGLSKSEGIAPRDNEARQACAAAKASRTKSCSIRSR